MSAPELALDAITVAVVVGAALVASVVTGALGYGFSSVTVPASLTVTTSRLLNPALVIVEVPVNVATLVTNRAGLRAAWPYARPLVIGLVPGVLIGALVLRALPVAHLKALTYAALLPLVLLNLAARWRSAGVVRQPPGGPSAVSVVVGVGVGALYATTTVSGPPLALYFVRRGLAHTEFRAALGAVRVIEATLALIVYAALGLLHLEGAVLALAMAPAILAGLPLGRRLARRLSAAAFSRAVLGLDAVLVSVGLASSANTLGAPPGAVALGLAALALVVVSTLWLQTALARQAPRNDADVAGLGRAVEAPQP